MVSVHAQHLVKIFGPDIDELRRWPPCDRVVAKFRARRMSRSSTTESRADHRPKLRSCVRAMTPRQLTRSAASRCTQPVGQYCSVRAPTTRGAAAALPQRHGLREPIPLFARHRASSPSPRERPRAEARFDGTQSWLSLAQSRLSKRSVRLDQDETASAGTGNASAGRDW